MFICPPLPCPSGQAGLWQAGLCNLWFLKLMNMDFANRKTHISAVDAISPALSHMAKVLFRPVKIIKWFKFGLVAFLVSLGSGGGGGGGGSNFDLPWGEDQTPSQIGAQVAQIGEWIQTHLTLIIILGIVAVVVITLIWTIIIYFSSRFSFVYLDGVIKNDLQIKRAYKENRTNGWSYFLWRIIFVPTALLAIVLLTGLPVIIILLIAKDKELTLTLILLLVFIALVFIGLCILLAVISVFTFDFVVPIMYLMKIKVLKAWQVLLALLKFNKTQFFLYILMKIVLGLAALMLMIIPCCLLGCISIPLYLLIVGLVVLGLEYPLIWIGLVPLALIIWVIGSVLWQTIISPITVFFRTYPLVFLEGFGDEFASVRLLGSTDASAPPSPAASEGEGVPNPVS